MGLSKVFGTYERKRQAQEDQVDLNGIGYNASILMKLFEAGRFQMSFKYKYEEASIDFKFEEEQQQKFSSLQFYGVDFQYPIFENFLLFGSWGIEKRSMSSIQYKNLVFDSDDIFPNRGTLNLSIGVGLKF